MEKKTRKPTGEVYVKVPLKKLLREVRKRQQQEQRFFWWIVVPVIVILVLMKC